MDERVAQLAYSTRHLWYPHYGIGLQLQYKECYIIQSGQHAVDYTGLRIWPGAHLLALFLLHSQHSLHGQVVCELGAGVGLCGLLAARYVRRVLLTDRVQAVLAVVQRNIELNQLIGAASSHVLEWGAEGAQALVSTSRLPVSLVVAADVVYPDTTDDSLHALFETVTSLLDSSSPSTQTPPLSSTPLASPLYGRFVLSYVNRSAATCRRFLLIAHSHGYTATHIPQAIYLVDEQQREAMATELQQLQGYILVFHAADETQRATGDADWLHAEPFVSMMASEQAQHGESDRTPLTEEDEDSALPMSGADDEVQPSQQAPPCAAV